MAPSHLRIDTSVAGYSAPSSSIGSSRSEHSPNPLRSAKSTGRLRSGSASMPSSPARVPKSLPSSNAHQQHRAQQPSSSSSRSSSSAYALKNPWVDALDAQDPDSTFEAEFVLAMHDFAPQHPNDTCLSFRAGQVIHVLNRDDSGWWDGELDGRRGWFPSNYVTADVGLLTEEELPRRSRNGAGGHAHTMSTVSTTSWTSTTSSHKSNPSVRSTSYSRTDHRPMVSSKHSYNASHSSNRSNDSSIINKSSTDIYCPPIMSHLLRGISLLQLTIKENKLAHIQPSTAYILSCVRTVLNEVGCLARDAPALKKFPVLAKERKRILSGLAGLVAKAKKASESGVGALESGTTNSDAGEIVSTANTASDSDVEGMVRLAGQLFAHVRSFLVIAAQCGIDVHLPASSAHSSSSSSSNSVPPLTQTSSSTDSVGRWDSQDGTLIRSEEPATPLPSEYSPLWETPGTGKTIMASTPIGPTTKGTVYRRKTGASATITTTGAIGSKTPPGLKARSMGDLKSRAKLQAELDQEREEVPPLPGGVGGTKARLKYGTVGRYAYPSSRVELPMKMETRESTTPVSRFASSTTLAKQPAYYSQHQHQASTSSISSNSSFSSNSSSSSMSTSSPHTHPSALPPIPSGPCTPTTLLEVLRHTHDAYLSTIAAFIGHAHSHSRLSHASSYGHMYDLVREVVEMVCRLLVIVEAVLRCEGLSGVGGERGKAEVRRAKEGLFEVTSTLADNVRMLTVNTATSSSGSGPTSATSEISEEEEKATLLRSATNALKAGSDCMNAVKKCLLHPRSSTSPEGTQPLLIYLPSVDELERGGTGNYTPSKFSHYPSRSVASASSLVDDGEGEKKEKARRGVLKELYRASGVVGEDGVVDEEDMTIQAQSVSLSFGSGEATVKMGAVQESEDPFADPTSSVAEAQVQAHGGEDKQDEEEGEEPIVVPPSPQTTVSESIPTTPALTSEHDAAAISTPTPIPMPTSALSDIPPEAFVPIPPTPVSPVPVDKPLPPVRPSIDSERGRPSFDRTPYSRRQVSLDRTPYAHARPSFDRDQQIPPPRPISPASSFAPSFAPTDSGTTWEGSQSQHRHDRQQSLEEKLLNGELPAIPPSEMEGTPGGARAGMMHPPRREDVNPLAWILSHDHDPEDVAYNSEGQLVGATLAALVERMTPHDSLVEPPFAAVFFLTFRQFTTPTELLDTLIARYNIMPPPGVMDQDLFLWQQRKGLPVRLRVSNFVKTWLESYWRPEVDDVVLAPLLKFTREALATMFPIPSQRILELIEQWQKVSDNGSVVGSTGGLSRLERARDAGFPLNPPLSATISPASATSPSEIPRPIMTKALLAALRNKNFTAISLTDFDPLELARQLTTMECSLYCAILPEEILETGQESKSGAKPANGGGAKNVKAVTSLSTVITGWIAESILNEPDTKKRTALVKFFIKVADRCTSLQNFSTPRSILAALDSSTISRLHMTWSGLPQKNKHQLEAIRKLADHARNYHEYRSRLRNTAPPAVPFLGLYLTDITFCREGNPSHRASPKNPDKKLLNFNKYHKLARIVQDMQRFQVPYNLKEIPEVQEYLKYVFEQSKQKGDLHDLYRRSLLVEPRRPADQPPTSDVRQLFGWATRSSSQVSTPVSAS
ncbi:ras GEF [Panus rudis PR-1116 ss-1]|nr:ras GEF [Panus rudis PR-1116 ss-1]